MKRNRFITVLITTFALLSVVWLMTIGCGDHSENLPGTSDTDNDSDSDFDADGGYPDVDGDMIFGHVAVAAFDTVPTSYFDQIRNSYRIYYGHTSHGSQIVTGVDMLADENSTLYASPDFTEPGGDLGHEGDLTWEETTRAFLENESNSDINVVMWSWCGGVSDNTVEGINTYLEAMDELEQDYPDRTFIYMTGHLDGSGQDGNLRVRNRQIRQYCEDHNKILFDFEDIESWDPNGNYYPDESDGCNWCETWCASHDCPSCESCSHSHCFNCYQKGKAFWTMMALLAGWDGTAE